MWWRFDFEDDVHVQLRERVRCWDDLSNNVFELLGVVVTAWIFVKELNVRPSYARDTILMRGNHTSALHWVSKCRGDKESRLGVLTRLLRCLEVGSGWWFDAFYVAGVDNSIADDISRWREEVIDDNLHAPRPDVAWCRQVLEPTGVELCSGILAATSSASLLRLRLKGLIRRVSGLGPLFGG